MDEPSPAVSVIVVAYKRLDLVERAVASALASRGVCLEVVVVNNDVALPVSAWADEVPDPRLRVIESGFNSGYAGALNRGIAATTGRYVFCQNQDLVVDPGHLAELVAFCDAHPRAAAASGKILRTGDGDAVFDTAGILMQRDRGAFDRGEGDADEGQFDAACEVFAASGAAFFARREALNDGDLGRGPFDEAFFMYKEEVDLCWRLRLRGWECWYVPGAIAWHIRTSRGLGGRGLFGSAMGYWRALHRRPAHVKVHSSKNHWLMLVKDDEIGALLRAWHRVALRETARLAVTAVSSPPSAMKAVTGFVRALPQALRDRRTIQRSRVVSKRDIARWFDR